MKNVVIESAREVEMHRSGRNTTARKTLALLLLAGLAARPALAGQIDPPGGPDAAASRMKTLQQIYERVTTGAATTADRARPFTDVDFSAGGSMHDLNEIFNALPAAATDGALAGEVCSPRSFWGLSAGAWGTRAGSRDCAPPEFGTDPGNQTIGENGSVTFALEVTDRATADADLGFIASSSNAALLPASAVAIVWNSPTAGKWNVTLTPLPRQSGSATVGIAAIDGQGNRTATKSFTLTVNAANLQPTISALPAAQQTDQNVPTSLIPFTIGDDHTAAGALAVSATSSNATIVPNLAANLTLGGSGAGRTLKVTPAANASGGPVTITITVQDAGSPPQSQTATFDLTVNHVNQPPTAGAVDRTAPGSRLATSTAYDLVTRPAVFTDVDAADTLTLAVLAPLPARGTAVVSGSGAGLKITYTTGAATGADSFSYVVCDSNGACAVNTVSVQIQ